MKIYVLTIHQVIDLEDLGIITKAFKNEKKAIAALKEWRDDKIKYCTDNEFEIECDTPTHFEAYEDGRYCSNHSLGTVEEIEVMQSTNQKYLITNQKQETKQMKKQKMSACESALSRLRTSLKEAILNDEVRMAFSPSDADGYYAEMRVNFGGLYFDMTIAKTFVCYHNPFVKGMFDNKDDFEALTELVNKRVKFLTPEERAKIVSLQAEIDAIKKGGQA